MSGEFRTQEIDAQPIMAARMAFPVSQVAEKLETMYAETLAVIRAAGAAPAGQPFAIYHAWDDVAGDVESGLPVEALVPAAGNVKARVLPAGRAVTTVYTGPYDGLVVVYLRLREWLLANKYVASGPPRYVFLNDPSEVPGPDAYKTKIIQPIE